MIRTYPISLVLRHLSAITISAALTVASPVGAATVGAIPGHFGVTATGAATYSIPFKLPSGIAGLTPHLGLVYSNRGGSGVVGYGWALSGFSTITRCSKTLASDGSNGGVTFSSNDRFCLDGNKLRQNIGTYGANDSTYRTEREAFARITSYTSGGAGAAPGTGPQWFTVESRNGLTYEYGKTADSEILNASGTAVRVWALDKISDKNGNSITFSYAIDSANGTYRPSQVEYTAHTGLAPSHTVIFDYASLPSSVNPPVRYIAGTKIRISRRLADIKIEYNGSVVTTYTLTYQNTSDTHRSRLASLTECAGSDCLPPTEFTWLNGTVGFGADHNATGGIATSDEYGSSHVMDFNGDGYADLVFPNEASGTWWIMFGGPNGLGGATDTSVSDAGYLYSRIIDYNSDGLADLLVTDSTTGKWRVLQSTGSTFISQSTTLSYKNADGSSYAANAEVVDFDGDGRDDLVWTDGDGNFYWVKNVNGAFDPSTKKKVYSASNTTITSGPGFSVKRSTQALDSAPDFNGDSLPDLMAVSQQTKAICDESGNCTPVITYTWILLVSDGQGGYQWYGSLSRGSDIATPIFAAVTDLRMSSG